MPSKLKKYYLIFSGYIYLWIVAGNILGEILVRLNDNQNSYCYPYIGMFGMFYYDCESILASYFWFITIEYNRFFVSVPSFIVTFLTGGNPFEAIAYLLISIPAVILIFIPGFLYWKKINKYLAWILITLHVSMIINLGLML